MKSSALLFLASLLCAFVATAQYKTAQPGYRYEFPRDHFNHPDFQTEWWYYTGNLTADDGRHFGFELTFFRQALNRDPDKKNTWDVQDVYLAHLALSDLDGQEFYHTERVNRSGPGIAGVDSGSQRIWNGNWNIQWKGNDQELRAASDEFDLTLFLHPAKQPVIHGVNGLSQKSEGSGRASHYISFTRLATSGALKLLGKTYQVGGFSWMDHEFFTHQLESNQAGWDWISVQLDDQSELMLYQIRRKDGSLEPLSSGTYVDPQGRASHLTSQEFSLQPQGDFWKSAVTGATYPLHWKIAVAKLGLALDVTTPLRSQELSGTTRLAPNYWEGAVRITGARNGAPAQGTGYLELTGYDKAVSFGPGQTNP